jgi:hypothetical protein
MKYMEPREHGCLDRRNGQPRNGGAHGEEIYRGLQVHGRDDHRELTMPKGPKGQKRPADVIGNAIRVARIATGKEEEDMPNDGKNAARQGVG